MAKVTIYIRVNDEEQWKAIKNKPEFIHKAINGAKLLNVETIYKTNAERSRAWKKALAKQTGEVQDA